MNNLKEIYKIENEELVFNKAVTQEISQAVVELYRIDLLKGYPNDGLVGYTSDLVYGVLNNIDKIDNLISESLTNYTIDRLSYIDRAIIRVATFEMISGVNKNQAINEALEITKVFTNLEDDKQKAFNNSVLDKISKRI